MAMTLKRRPMRRLSRFQGGGEVLGGVEKVNMDQPEIMQGPRPEVYQPSTQSEGNLITSGITSGLKLAGLGSSGSSKRRGGKVTKVIKPKPKGKRR